MAKQLIGLGTTANDGTGSPLRTGGEIVNDNATELYDRTDGNVPHQLFGVRVDWDNESTTVNEVELIWAAVNSDAFTGGSRGVLVQHGNVVKFKTTRNVYTPILGTGLDFDIYETYWELRRKLTVTGGAEVSLGSGNTLLDSTNGVMTFAGRIITEIRNGVAQKGGFTVDVGETGATPIETTVNAGAEQAVGKGVFVFKGTNAAVEYAYIYNGVDEKIGLGTGITTTAAEFTVLSEVTANPAPEYGAAPTLQEVTAAGSTTTDIVTVEQININKSAAAEEYEVTERGVTLGFPVPTIRPTTADKVIAVDIMPNGSPADFSANGVAWLDICNEDIKGDVVSAFSALRAGITSTQSTFGAISFNGAAVQELVFVLGTINDEVGRIKTDGVLQWEKNVVIDTDTDIPTLKTQSDVANGTLTTFISTLTYDSGRFQNATRLSAEAGDLVLQATTASKDIVFIAGAGLMSTNEVARMKANGRLQFPAGQTKYADDAAAGVGGLVAGEVYATATGELRIKL